MTELKREYVVPLRRKANHAPKWRRSKKAVVVLKDFIKKHMKTENVIVCKELNEHLWERGSKHPPGKVSVIALKTTISGTEKTLVNLASAGIDGQMKEYNVEAPVAETKTPKTQSKEAEVKEAEVKEVETKEVKKETTTSKKEDKKTEVKKDE